MGFPAYRSLIAFEQASRCSKFKHYLMPSLEFSNKLMEVYCTLSLPSYLLSNSLPTKVRLPQLHLLLISDSPSLGVCFGLLAFCFVGPRLEQNSLCDNVLDLALSLLGLESCLPVSNVQTLLCPVNFWWEWTQVWYSTSYFCRALSSKPNKTLACALPIFAFLKFHFCSNLFLSRFKGILVGDRREIKRTAFNHNSLNFNVDTNHPGILLKFRFKFSRSESLTIFRWH